MKLYQASSEAVFWCPIISNIMEGLSIWPYVDVCTWYKIDIFCDDHTSSEYDKMVKVQWLLDEF